MPTLCTPGLVMVLDYDDLPSNYLRVQNDQQFRRYSTLVETVIF